LPLKLKIGGDGCDINKSASDDNRTGSYIARYPRWLCYHLDMDGSEGTEGKN
jgi:hypothetical protein